MDKRTLLSKLLHQELQNIQNTIENQCNYFLKNEIISRKGWNQKGFFVIEFWYSLIENILKTIEKNCQLWKHPNWFTDHSFNGCTVCYTLPYPIRR